MLKLRLINLWIQDSRIFVNWDKESRTILHEIFIGLRTTIQSLLPPHCTHIKNRGGVKGSVRWLYSRLNKFKFVGRFDIASYYNSINHSQLLNLIRSEINNEALYHVIKEYLELPDYMNTGKGIVAGCSISPLIGALYLLPLDRAMQKNVASGKIFYLRFMDDILILSKRRWHLKEAIKKMNQIVSSLGLLLHPEKRFIGRIKKGFDFLGYQFTSGKKLRPSEISLQRFTKHAC